jgi:replicative DNA helicase
MYTPHQNLEAEYSALGYILLSNREDYLDKLKVEYFTDELAIKCFKLMKEAQLGEKPIDLLNTGIPIDEGLGLISRTSLTHSFETGLVALLEAFLVRSSQQLGLTLIEHIKTSQEAKQIVNLIEGTIEEYNQNTDKQYNLYSMKDSLRLWMENLNLKTTTQKGLKFNITGLENYEVKAGHLCSVVARAKAGKTSLLCQQALHGLQNGYSVLFISLEMQPIEVMDKMIAYYADLNPLAVENYGAEGQSEHNTQKITKAFQQMENYNFDIYHSPYPSIAEIDSQIKRYKQSKDKVLIVIDQLQFITSARNFDTKVKEYDFILSRLKKTALSYQVPIILAHQLNRNIEMREWKYPLVSDIKDSGRVEEISDLLILFAQDKDNLEQRLCTVVSRHTVGGQLKLQWNTKKAKFIIN